jgi:hypothetical protein
MSKNRDQRMHQLKAPPGTDEANFGEERFRVDNDGMINVPEEAVAGLVAQGGFEEIRDDRPVVPVGFGRVRHADPEASCSGDKQDDGSFMVSIESVNELVSHGFTPVE